MVTIQRIVKTQNKMVIIIIFKLLFSEHIVNSLNKVERLLGLNDPNRESSDEELAGDLLERVASDVNYLNFCVSKCDAKAFVEEIRPRLDVIGKQFSISLFQT